MRVVFCVVVVFSCVVFVCVQERWRDDIDLQEENWSIPLLSFVLRSFGSLSGRQ